MGIGQHGTAPTPKPGPATECCTMAWGHWSPPCSITLAVHSVCSQQPCLQAECMPTYTLPTQQRWLVAVRVFSLLVSAVARCHDLVSLHLDHNTRLPERCIIHGPDLWHRVPTLRQPLPTVLQVQLLEEVQHLFSR